MNGEKNTNNTTSNTQCVTPRKLKFEQLRADYELFLQTFESILFIFNYYKLLTSE